jgi:TonB family protein
MQDKALFSQAFMVQPSLVSRLITEIGEASRQIRQDPAAFFQTALKGDNLGGRRRKMLFRLGLALGIMVYALFLTGMVVVWMVQHAKAKTNDGDDSNIIHVINPDDYKAQNIDQPKAAKKAGGGGGGGRNTPTPPSKGQLPMASLQPPIIAPRPEPQLKPPSLPMPEMVQVQPNLIPKPDPLAPTGLPTGVPGPPSAGPGSGSGMGSGSGGGMGSGDGTGVGPGHGYNMGGGGPQIGGGSRNAIATEVDTRPVALNRPRPNYTEDARKNKVQGVIRARALIGADGSVKDVRLVSHLPDGLDEEAILAVKQMRFRPAMKSGQPVNFWQMLEVEFNLR